MDRIQVKEATTERRGWSERTSLHAQHRRSVPLGKIRVEIRSTFERCRRMSVPWWTETKNKLNRENVKKKSNGSEWTEFKRKKQQQTPEGGVDVLSYMVVTAAVFHLETSALKLEAPLNAVGECRCRGGQNPKIN